MVMQVEEEDTVDKILMFPTYVPLPQEYVTAKWNLPTSCGQHFRIGTKVTVGDRPIISNLTAEIIQRLSKREKEKERQTMIIINRLPKEFLGCSTIKEKQPCSFIPCQTLHLVVQSRLS